MKTTIRQWVLSLVLGLVALSAVASATTVSRIATHDSLLAAKIRKELVALSNYSIFDNFSFRIDGSKVALRGQVRWPALKNSAERVVANIEGITSVENQIEILPNSFRDDRIRLDVAKAIFSNPVLSKYVWSGSSFGLLPHRSDIHIVVKNGNVSLEGLVRRKTDRDIAFLMANGVFGVFSVTNNLRVENPVKES